MTRKHEVRRGDGYIRVRPRADGGHSYQARWHDGTKWRSKTFRGAIEQAEDFLRELGRDRRSGRYVPDADVTLLNAIDDYLDRGSARWRGNTQATYGSVRTVIAEYPIANVLLSDLTPRTCQLWIDQMVKRYSAARMIVVRAVVNGALREAMRLGIMNTNPMHGVRMPSPGKRDYTVWSIEDAAKAIDLSADDDLLHTWYTVALTSGMRPGEIRALRWSDIDMDAGRITVARTMTRDVAYGTVMGTTTKGGRSRQVVIPETTLTVLRRHRALQNERRLRADTWSDLDMVFDRGNGSPLPQQTIWRRHRDFTSAQGLPACRLHDLRHTAASMLFQAGIPVKVISDVLGHSSSTVTMDIYAHTSEAMQREAAQTLGAVMSRREKNV